MLQRRIAFLVGGAVAIAGSAALLLPDRAVGGLMHNGGTGRPYWCYSWTAVAR